MKKIVSAIIVLIIIIVIALAASLFISKNNQAKQRLAAVSSFEECAALGNPIMESYPEQCRTADGRSFTRDIGNELEKRDLIMVDSPRPGETVKSPLTITGQARGTWFFEASFPVRLLDEKGQVLGQGIAQAQSDWMTEEFVPFMAVLEFSTPTTMRGNLILKKDNPSGLPEHDDELRIPVRF